MTVDGVPNVRVCTEPIREGAVVEGQNVRWSLDFDFMSVTDKLGGPFTPVGFYYRTFIRPRAAWPLYEKFLRSAAGLGKLDPHAGHTRRYDTEHRRARVLVVGGGEAGRAAALEAAKAGPGVVLVDEDAAPRRSLARRRRGARARARARNLGGRPRPGRRRHDPLSLPGRADRRRDRRDGAAARLSRERPRRRDAPRRRPPARSRLLGQAGRARDRARLRRRDARDRRRARRGRDRGRRRSSTCATHVRASSSRRAARVASGASSSTARAIGCDLLVASGGRQPAYSLLAQAGARVEYDEALGVFVPTELPAGDRGGRQRHGRGSLEDRARTGVPGQGQVLRLRLRGRDDEGHEARDRRGLRLDRAREALHDDDDGALPGEALPPLEHPRVRAREPDVRVRDRHDDGTAAVGAGRARPARGPRADADATRLDPLAPRGGRRDDPVGRAVEAAVRLRRAPGGRGARRARVARRDRRLDARASSSSKGPRRSRCSSGSIRTASAT